ncbi:MAG TPA: hypothetical protein VGN42_23005 [Pirellulales bacterium]|jgi:hypothetical protein|nr:hypothetical protein [Pirellulales bacterium]
MKHKWLAFALVAAVLGAPLVWRQFAAADDLITTDRGTTRVSLKVQLEKGLRAMRPQDFAFLGVVLQQVDDGELPRDLVDQAFLWARRQRSYRVQYFEKVLRLLAKRQGIAFDTGDVSSFNPGFNRASTPR